MRRVVLALLGTTIATTLLIGLKSQGAAGRQDYVAQAQADPGSGASGRGPSTRPSAGPGAGTTAPTRPAGKPKASTTGPATKAPTKGPTTKATTKAPTSRTILGDAFPARNFGDVQVRIVVTGTHLDDVQVVKMSNRPRNAPSLLRQEALDKQSANLSNVSGATYTSQAYQQSLQSALNKV
jgi:uncharacterized protein with FMN-binding domain